MHFAFEKYIYTYITVEARLDNIWTELLGNVKSRETRDITMHPPPTPPLPLEPNVIISL